MSPRILKRVAREPGVLSESDKWRTPPPCFLALHDEFNFVVDLAASDTDHLCPHWIGPGLCTSGDQWHKDALAANCSWSEIAWSIVTGNYLKESQARQARAVVYGFENPPYSSQLVKQFLEKTAEQTRVDFGVAALLPDTHDTQWYRHLRWASEIRRIPHRVPYLKADGSTKAGAMFPSCVAIFRPQPGVRNPAPRVVEWTWRVE